MAAAAMPFMNTLRRSFNPAASPGRAPTTSTGMPEWSKEPGEPLCPGARGERGCREARRRDDSDEGDVDERHGQGLGELALQLRRRRVQVGVQRPAPKRAGHVRGDLESDCSSVDAEHDIGACDGALRALRVGDPLRLPRGIEAPHDATGSHEVGCNPAAGLTEAEHGDLHQPSTSSRNPLTS